MGKFKSERLYKAICSGNFERVKFLIETNSQYVNCDIGRDKDDYFHKVQTPLCLALSRISRKHDVFYKISKYLLKHPNIDVNARSGHRGLDTILGYLVDYEFETLLGIEILLNDGRVDVNSGGTYPPLYFALDSIEMVGDYFYKAAMLLFKHKRIEVNCKAILAELCMSVQPSSIGIQLLLNDERLHIYKGSPAYESASKGREDILQMILDFPNFDVNKACECCTNVSSNDLEFMFFALFSSCLLIFEVKMFFVMKSRTVNFPLNVSPLSCELFYMF